MPSWTAHLSFGPCNGRTLTVSEPSGTTPPLQVSCGGASYALTSHTRTDAYYEVPPTPVGAPRLQSLQTSVPVTKAWRAFVVSQFGTIPAAAQQAGRIAAHINRVGAGKRRHR